MNADIEPAVWGTRRSVPARQMTSYKRSTRPLGAQTCCGGLRAESAGKLPGDDELRGNLLALGYAPKAARRIEKVYKALLNDKAFFGIGNDLCRDAATPATGDESLRETYETLLQMREDGIRIFIDARREKVPQALRIVGDWLSRTCSDLLVAGQGADIP